MFYLFVALIILASILLAFVVLIQNPKGGGLASNFAGSNNLMGVKRTGDILEKGTWILIIAIMVISLLINVSISGTSQGNSGGSELQDQISAPAMPSTTLPEVPATPEQDSTK